MDHCGPLVFSCGRIRHSGSTYYRVTTSCANTSVSSSTGTADTSSPRRPYPSSTSTSTSTSNDRRWRGSFVSTLWTIALLCYFATSTTCVVSAQEQRHYYRFGGTMDLSPIEDAADLTPDAIAAWERFTAEFYIAALEARTDLDIPISDPQVTINLLFASPPTEQDSVLAMSYRATASFVSATSDYDPGVLALPRFRSQPDVLQYVVQLRQSGFAVFQQLMSLSLTVQSSTPIPPPTPSPTQTPTRSPTRLPTPEPTLAPTLAPVPVPTATPGGASLTARPTTRAPVLEDTAEPTLAPVDPETPVPTPVFTLEETMPPVDPGTSVPTPAGTFEETMLITAPPTVVPNGPPPTNFPTPLAPPTPSGLQNKYASTELTFRFVPSEEMEGIILQDWKTMTRNHLVAFIRTLDASLLLEEDEDGALEIENVSQSGRLESRRHRRLEEDTAEDVDVDGDGDDLDEDDSATQLYVLDVEFVTKLTLPPSYDANSLVNGAFATRNRRQAYRQLLMEQSSTLYDPPTSDFFQYLEEIFLGDNTDDGNGSGGGGSIILPDGNDVGGSNTGAIVGGVVGGLALIALVAALIYRMNSKATSKDTASSGEGRSAPHTDREGGSPSSAHGGIGAGKSNGNTPATGLTWEPAEQPSRLNQEIVVSDNAMDDISTIGDPYLYGAPPIQEDERTATTSVFQTETYNALLGRPNLEDYGQGSSLRSSAEDTEFSAFTGASKYLNQGGSSKTLMNKSKLLGELGLTPSQNPMLTNFPQTVDEETSFEQRLFPMGSQKTLDVSETEERSLDYSLPTALM